jgi:hypothetical protein
LLLAPGHEIATKASAEALVRVPVARVFVDARPTPLTVPASFLGLSTEYWTLPLYRRQLPLLERVVSLLEVPGDGPLVLRVGGDSADESFWQPAARKTPGWTFRLTPAWLGELRRLVDFLGARVILDLNLFTGSPEDAARWARAALSALPHGSVLGFEVGNEPDIYSHRYWMRTTELRGPGRLVPVRMTPAVYAHDFERYGRALSGLLPRPRLIGPVLAHPRVGLRWVRELLVVDHRVLGMLTAHLYPFSRCTPPSAPNHPTIARLLSDSASAEAARWVLPMARLAHRAHLPFRLTELNSVTCWGSPGVSDTFANALWALDTLFDLMKAGVDGVNVHVRAHTINAPFILTAKGLTARPLLYGLIMFTRALGPGARLIDLGVRQSGGVDVDAWAVRLADARLHVLLINKGRTPVRVLLPRLAGGPAEVELLLGPSPASRRGVTLAGQFLGRDGRWLGRRVIDRILPGAEGYELLLKPASAALLSTQDPSNAHAPGRRGGLGRSPANAGRVWARGS